MIRSRAMGGLDIEINGAPDQFERKTSQRPDAENFDTNRVLTDEEASMAAGGGTPTAWPPH